MIKKNINIKTKSLLLLVLFSFLLRLATVYFFADTYIENEWNILLQNLVNYKSYSYYVFDKQLIPSVYMPPMYAFFLYLIKTLTNFNQPNLLYAIFIIQITLSTYGVYVFYQINQNFFSNKISFINSIIFSIIPLNIYYSGQISSINLQIIFSLLFLKFLLLIIKKKNPKNIILFSIISGLLILTRGEFILIFVLILFFIFLNKKINATNLIKIFIITFLLISPYVARNYIHFNDVIIVKSLGYNLWKGNNQLSRVEGFENLEKVEFKNLKFKINNIKKNKYYEINRDDIFLHEAINNLKGNLYWYFKLFIKKFFSYFFVDVDSNYPKYYNFFHILPIALISILSFPGLFFFYKTRKFENRCFELYLFLNLIIFSVFFILPRYKLVILPIQIILAAYFIIYIMRRYVSK